MEQATSRGIIQHLCQTVGGDWLLVGGTLVQLVFDGDRSTEDIDLVFMGHPTKGRDVAQQELFRHTMTEFGFGPELVNLAVEFFVRELVGWESEVELLEEGRRGRVFRPTLTLFCALKLRRASEIDLRDVESAIEKEGVLRLDWSRLQSWISDAQLKLLKELTSSSS